MKRIFRSKAWRSRAALAGVVAVCMAATTLAVTGAGADTAGMKFVQSGHLIYNSTLGTLFHIDGGTKNVDGQLPYPGLGEGVRTVQTDTQGFMLARGSITEFGKSDLKVADPRPAPSDEQPAALEAPGVAFAVYREAGAISRLGARPVTVSVPGALGPPVVTSNGTLWVHRITNRELCQLPVDADRLSCPAELTSGHIGALTVVKDQVVFVDTTARELRALGADGFGRTVPIPNVPLTPDSIIAASDVNGRIAIVDPAKNELQLVDAALDGDRRPAATVAHKLPAGKYTQVASSGNGVALIDESSNTLVTMNADGGKQTSRAIPGKGKGADKAKPGKRDRPELFRGADKRLYVDSVSGEHAMVVDDDGEVTQVEARDPGKGDGQRVPETKPTTPPPSVPPSTPPATKPTPPRTQGPPRTVGPTAGEGRNKPERPRRTEPTRTNKPKPPESAEPSTSAKPKPKPKPKPVKASPAAAPSGLTAKGSDGAVTVTWRQPNLNGGAFVRYNVSRNGSPGTTTARRYTWSGLTNETAYTFQVRAVTRGSDGKLLIGSPATVTGTPKGLGRLRISYGEKVSKYEDRHCPEGTQDDCAFVQVEASGLEPNTTYVLRAYASAWGEIHDGGYEVETDDDGRISKKMFHNAAVGQRIYVTATGPGGPYRSNTVTWPSG